MNFRNPLIDAPPTRLSPERCPSPRRAPPPGRINGATRANPLELDIHVHHHCKVDPDGYFRAPSCWLQLYDNAKRRKYEGVCHALGHSFLPMGFTAWGAMSSGTTQLLEKVADAAHEQGYVGEAWGTLKGDRIRAMHGLYMGVSYALNKSVAIQLDRAQTVANRAFVCYLV